MRSPSVPVTASITVLAVLALTPALGAQDRWASDVDSARVAAMVADAARTLSSIEGTTASIALQDPTSACTCWSAATNRAFADSVARATAADIEALPDAPAPDLEWHFADACGRRHITFCMASDGPTPSGTDLINHLGRGDWDAAIARRAQLDGRVAPQTLMRWLAWGLEQPRTNCGWQACDLARFDSLFAAWVPEMEAAARDHPGAPADTLRQHLAAVWAGRDPARAGLLMEAIEDPALRARALGRVYRGARPLHPLAALEIHMRFAPAEAPMGGDAFTDLMRLGRTDEANTVLERLGPNQRLAAVLGHARVLQMWGRWSEAAAITR